MFKLLKKVRMSFQDTNEVIEKIHNEFDSASERILAEAKAIIANNKKADKGERLKLLGFDSSLPVKQSLENIEKEKIAQKIEYFKTYYPYNKFITEVEVKKICEKYGLLFGDARLYIGDIPEKNLLEIENFKLREEDMDRRSNLDDYYDHKRIMSGINFFGSQSRQPTYEAKPPQETRYYYSKPSLKICAPEKDFDTRYMEVRDGYKLQYDPIVLQPVKEGYLIVSKWGIDGEDEDLINEKMN
jgi:hypothetical protein